MVDPEFPDVYVTGAIREQGGCWLVSIFLVNAQAEPERSRDRAWIFQPELSVESDSGDGQAIFVRQAPRRDSPTQDQTLDPAAAEEERVMEMLYRKSVEFAVGHGVGVHPEVAPGDPSQAVSVVSAVVPAYEVPRATPPTVDEIPDLAGVILDMKALAEAASSDLSGNLAPLPHAYERWVAAERLRIGDPAEMLDEYTETSRRAFDDLCARRGRRSVV